MKTTVRHFIPAFSLGIVLLLSSCEKTEMVTEDPCQTIETATCTIDGKKTFNLILISDPKNTHVVTYLFGSDNKLTVQFLTNATASYLKRSLTTERNEVAFSILYEGVVYNCNSTSGTVGTYAGTYVYQYDWSRSFHFVGIESITGKKIQVSGSFGCKRTGRCYEEDGGWGFNWG